MRRIALLLVLFFSLNAAAIDLYVIGSNVDGHCWELSEPSGKMTQISSGVYEWSGQVLATGFKINDGTWDNPKTNTYNIGSNGNTLTLGKEYNYKAPTDDNIFFDGIFSIENPKVTVDTNRKTILVVGDIKDTESDNYYFCGSFNDFDIDAPQAKMEKDGDKYVSRNVNLSGTYGYFRIYSSFYAESWGYGDETECDCISKNNHSAKLTKEIGYGNAPMRYELSGKYDIYWSPKTQIITFVKVGSSESSDDSILYLGDLYIIGDNVNGHNWLLSDPDAKFNYIGNGFYQWAGFYLGNGFKINDGTWQNNYVNDVILNIGGSSENLHLGQPYEFIDGPSSGNIGYADVVEVINPLVTIDVAAKTVMVQIDGHTLNVNLPNEASDSKYKNCIIELTEIESGSRHRYVVTDRLTYSFQGVRTGFQYTVRLISSGNFELGKIDNIIIGSNDKDVTFTDLKSLYSIKALVYDEYKNLLEDGYQVEWLKVNEDGTNTYLRNVKTIGELPEGLELICRVGLDDELVTKYIKPGDIHYWVTNSDNTVEVELKHIPSVLVRGSLINSDDRPIKDGIVSINQTINGQYPHSCTCITDSDGKWEVSIANVSNTRFSFAAKDCASQQLTIDSFELQNNTCELEPIKLKSVIGARIYCSILFKTAGDNDFVEYSDLNNISISVSNLTQNRVISEISTQLPCVAILDDNIKDGDELKISISSKDNTFNTQDQVILVGDDHIANAEFKIIQKGCLSATFGMTDNPKVISILYNENGELIKTARYIEASVKFDNLNEGEYTLISIGESDLLSSVLHLSGYGELGLKEGIDYVQNSILVEQGKVTKIHIENIPSFDESIFYYTSPTTSYFVNKSSVIIGSYLTLGAEIDFKGVYKNEIKDVVLYIDLPRDCDFVNQSVIYGALSASYTIDENKLIIPLGNTYSDQIRFCVIPTKEGLFTATASLAFEYKNQNVLQPLGSVQATVNSHTIVVPSIINNNTFPIYGTAPARSNVRIFGNNLLIGECSSNSNGDWRCTVSLSDVKEYQRYPIYAIITTIDERSIETECKYVTIDNDKPDVLGVEMINHAHSALSFQSRPYITYFDFHNARKTDPYWYSPSYPTFSFGAAITPSKYEKVTDVFIYVLLQNGTWDKLKTIYDANTGLWMASANYTYGRLPLNVGVSYLSETSGISIPHLLYLMNQPSILKESLDDDYSVTETNGEYIFTPGKQSKNDIIIKSLRKNGNKETIAYYENGEEGWLTIDMYSGSFDTRDCQQIKVDNNLSLWIEPGNSYIKIVYPKDLILQLYDYSDNNDCQGKAFATIKSMFELIEDNDFVIVEVDDSKTPKSSRRKAYVDDMADKALGELMDQAISNCPDMDIIANRVRDLSNNSHNINPRLDRAKNFLSGISNVLDALGVDGPTSDALGVVENSIDAGQSIGNYVNDLEFKHHIAQLQGVGCLPQDLTPDFPCQNPNANCVMDPSGYVYEAVPSNRVEGVQASIYYKELKENMYGDLYEEVVLWNAEEYAQKNPLFTDENGAYQWDVPQGLWQVKFEKDGYETAFSDWLPVPPPQLDVNIGIIQNKQPEIRSVKAYETGVEISFDKFMDATTINEQNIYVMMNGIMLDSKIRLLDLASLTDTNGVDNKYVSKVRIDFKTPLPITTKDVRIIVNKQVKSYAGITMAENYSQIIDVEKEVQMLVADDVQILYNNEKEILISALPFEGGIGKTLTVLSSSDKIATVSPARLSLDNNATCKVIIKGNMPGTCQLSFKLDDCDLTGTCVINVVSEVISAEAPKSSRASGSTVYRGTKIELSTDTKNGVIYYTTDGTCPCDDNGTRRKYSVPITINEDTHILALTVSGDSGNEVSDVVEFNYYIKRNDMTFDLPKGWKWVSHSFDDIINVENIMLANDAIIAIQGQNGCIERTLDGSYSGNLMSISPLESYKVHTSESIANIHYNNYAWNTKNAINITSGWNWIGYPMSQVMSINEAFALTESEYLDVILGQDGFAQYDGEKWIGSLEVLRPGLGYMYKSQSDKYIKYNDQIVSKAISRIRKHSTSNYLDIYKYSSIMPVVGKIIEEDAYVNTDDYEIIAFSDGECRGTSTNVEDLFFLNVYGNASEKILLKVKKKNSDETVGIEELNFTEDIAGCIAAPILIKVAKEVNIENIKIQSDQETSIITRDKKIYFQGISINDINNVSVYDMIGNLVVNKERPDSYCIDVSDLIEGVYFVNIDTKQSRYNAKIILQ